MHDVAVTAGVSLSTVSRVVNGDARVRALLAAKVVQAIDELGYRRDLTASSLRRADRASTLIGLVVDDLGNPFFASMQRAIEDVSREHGVLALAGSSAGEPSRERELVEAFAARRIDGLIIAPVSADQTYLARELADGLALVYVDRAPVGIDADAVLVDNVGGACRGVEHLLAAGHRRVAYLGDRQHLAPLRDRLVGYRLALAGAGLPIDPALIRQDVSRSPLAAAEVEVMLALPDPPTAFFAAENTITIGVVQALKRLGRQHEVGLVGFDDLDLADAVVPGLTVIAQEPAVLGRTAAELLFQRLSGDGEAARRVIEPTRLVARGSGEIRARPARMAGTG